MVWEKIKNINPLKNLFPTAALQIPITINTWNHRIIAREKEIFTDALLEKVANMGKKFNLNLVPIENTFFLEDFKKLLNKDMKKYGFITENLKFLNDLSHIVSQVRVPEQILLELKWLKENYSYNYHHVVAVTALSSRMARDFLEGQELVDTAEAAILYDIGIGHIPSKIIQKVGKLDPKERNIVSYHPIYSVLLMAHYYQDYKHPRIEIVLNHHENLNGTGYPRKIKNSNMISQIIHLADTFDALISARPDRRFFTTLEAFKICEEEINQGKIAREILPIIYSYYLFINEYPYE